MENFQFRPYYCPKCVEKIFYRKWPKQDTQGRFYCNACSEYFTYGSFFINNAKKLAVSSRKFSKIREVAYSLAQELYDAGYTYSEIAEQTLFPMSIIRKGLEGRRQRPVKQVSQKEFISELKQSDEKRDWIIKALEMGCTFDQIERLFDVGPQTISTIKKKYMPTPKYRIEFDDHEVKIFNKAHKKTAGPKCGTSYEKPIGRPRSRNSDSPLSKVLKKGREKNE